MLDPASLAKEEELDGEERGKWEVKRREAEAEGEEGREAMREGTVQERAIKRAVSDMEHSRGKRDICQRLLKVMTPEEHRRRLTKRPASSVGLTRVRVDYTEASCTEPVMIGRRLDSATRRRRTGDRSYGVPRDAVRPRTGVSAMRSAVGGGRMPQTLQTRPHSALDKSTLVSGCVVIKDVRDGPISTRPVVMPGSIAKHSHGKRDYHRQLPPEARHLLRSTASLVKQSPATGYHHDAPSDSPPYYHIWTYNPRFCSHRYHQDSPKYKLKSQSEIREKAWIKAFAYERKVVDV